MSKEFLDSISEGKWFVVNSKYGYRNAVKMIKSKYSENTIHSVWLSSNDPESMVVEDYFDKDWSYVNGVFQTNGAGVYHFGSNEVEEDSIYEEDGSVNVDRMTKVIIDNTEKEFITEDEIKSVWSKLSVNEQLDFEELKCK